MGTFSRTSHNQFNIIVHFIDLSYVFPYLNRIGFEKFSRLKLLSFLLNTSQFPSEFNFFYIHILFFSSPYIQAFLHFRELKTFPDVPIEENMGQVPCPVTKVGF